MDRVSSHIKQFPSEYLGGQATYESVRNPTTRTTHSVRHEDHDGDLDCWIVGEILGRQHGTKLGASGNRLSQGHRFFKPMKDGDCVQDVMAIRCPSSATSDVVAVWDRQLKMLADFKDEDNINDSFANEYPQAIKNWGVQLSELPERLYVTWEKYQTVDRTQTIVQRTKSLDKVKLGAVYEPTVLQGFSKPYFDLQADVLRQHLIYDSNGNLIPPWRTWCELTPGTLMIFNVALHCKDVDINPTNATFGFNRTYEIRGLAAVVMEQGSSAPQVPALPLVPSAYERAWVENHSFSDNSHLILP